MLLPTSLMLVVHFSDGLSILQLSLNPVVLFSFQLSNNCWVAALYLYMTWNLEKVIWSFLYVRFTIFVSVEAVCSV